MASLELFLPFLRLLNLNSSHDLRIVSFEKLTKAPYFGEDRFSSRVRSSSPKRSGNVLMNNNVYELLFVIYYSCFTFLSEKNRFLVVFFSLCFWPKPFNFFAPHTRDMNGYENSMNLLPVSCATVLLWFFFSTTRRFL